MMTGYPNMTDGDRAIFVCCVRTNSTEEFLSRQNDARPRSGEYKKILDCPDPKNSIPGTVVIFDLA
jgi:hypothetical protein